MGEPAATVLETADRVEVMRIAPQRDKTPDDKTVLGYPVRATGAEQGKEFAASLRDVLLNDASYEWEIAKLCEFEPGVAFRVWSGKKSILVLLCFQCDAVGIASDETNEKTLHVRDDDPARPALLKLAKQSLPNDKEIQGL